MVMTGWRSSDKLWLQKINTRVFWYPSLRWQLLRIVDEGCASLQVSLTIIDRFSRNNCPVLVHSKFFWRKQELKVNFYPRDASAGTRRTIAQVFWFTDAGNLAKLKLDHPQRRRQMQVGYVKCSCGIWKLATSDAKRCQLSSVARLSYWASTLFVCSTFAVRQRVERVCARQLILVMILIHKAHPMFF